MEDQFTAVYIMVRKEELEPEDGGSYERPLAKQKEDCLRFLKDRLGAEADEKVEVYTSRRQLLTDLERHQIKRIVVRSLDRLGSSREERDAILFELKMEGVEVLSVSGEGAGS